MRATPVWAKELEAELAAGKTLVTFTAVSGNDSDSCSLTVRVRDAVPPRVYNCPSDFNVYLDEGQVKRQVFQDIPDNKTPLEIEIHDLLNGYP